MSNLERAFHVQHVYGVRPCRHIFERPAPDQPFACLRCGERAPGHMGMRDMDQPAPPCNAAITVVDLGQMACDGHHLNGTWHGASGESHGLRWRITWEPKEQRPARPVTSEEG